MPILESIAAANAAYSVIRTALSNGRETAGLIGAVGKFIGAEEDVKDALAKKKRNPIAAIAGGQQGDWEEFQALEKLKEQRRELESWVRLYGSSGQWDRWQEWQKEARKQRQAAKKAREIARQKRNEQIALGAAILLAVGGAVGGVYYIGVLVGKF
mgnify:CR=1 FL=1|jgi:hypothetical protein